MAGLQKQSYLKGAAILVMANFTVKIIGAVFKIPLANIIGEKGMALFSTAYNLYAVLFVIATAGLPVAVSKMVSECVAKNRHAEAKKIFHAAMTLLTAIGLLGAAVMFFGARIFADLIVVSPDSYLGILAISPAIFFVAVVSAFRGFFQGHSNMTPTALSEIAEALGKLVIGLLLAYLLLPYGLPNAAAGAVLGVTAGAFFACIIMFITYAVNQNKTSAVMMSTGTARPMKQILWELLKIAVPITIGAAVSSLTNIIDMVMIRQRLQSITVTPELFQTLTNYFGIPQLEAVIGELMQVNPSEILYGSYSGFAIPMFNLPPTIVMALSMSVVPAISGAFALKNKNQARRLTESTVRITTMFAVPCAVGLSVLSMPILTAVYNNARAQSMLAILSYAVIFVCLVSVTTAILQASGNVMLPVRNMLIGGVIKIVTNYVFIAIPSIHINGAPISTNLCYLTIAVLNILAIRRIIKPEFSFVEFIVKPVASAIVMGFGAFFSYQAAARLLEAPQITTLVEFLPQSYPITPVDSGVRMKTVFALCIAIGAGAVLYAIMLFLLRSVKRIDVEMLPKGEKIAAVLDKFHLLS